MFNEDGKGRWIQASDRKEAANLGWRDQAPTQLEQSQNQPKTSIGTMVNNAAEKVASIPGAMYQQAGVMQSMLSPFSNATDRGAAMGELAAPGVQSNAEARQRGAGPIETAASTVAPYIGTDPTQLANAAQRGDVVGMADATSGTWAPMLAGKLVGETAKVIPDIPKGVAVDAANTVKGAISDAVTNARPSGAQAAVMPEVANMPPKAVLGAENIFRASAPVGSDPQFRANLYASAGDLAEIGRDINLSEAKGGVINPDMRVRATVNAINDHLHDMYAEERAPQIARNSDAAVVPKLGADAQVGLSYLSKNAGLAADRALATKALTGEPLTLQEVDSLARATNRELAPLRGMTPQELAVSEGNSKRMGSLQGLDRNLSDSIAQELSNRGEAGIKGYERRYAGLSSIRDQLQARMNAVELNQPGVVKAVLKPVISAITGGKSGIASASQAAVADVNIGKMLQNGFQSLADSGIKATREVGTGAPPIKGLLPAAQIQLPSSLEGVPTGTQPPPTNYTTAPQRLGRLLPEQAGASHPIPLPSSLEGVPTGTQNPPTNYTTTPLRKGLLLPEQAGGRDLTPAEVGKLPMQDAIEYMRKQYLRKRSGG
jgi:hypothetical protein